MELEARKVAPGSRLMYACPVHSDVLSDKPGTCPREECGKALVYRIVSDPKRVDQGCLCPMHPGKPLPGPAPCPDCHTPVKRVEYEKFLAVPRSAVIDTGRRKILYLDRGRGVYEAVEATLGLRGTAEVKGAGSADFFVLIKGAAAGDRVVTSGAFLLDAETRLDPSVSATYFGAGGK
jgi:hypothetical protein